MRASSMLNMSMVLSLWFKRTRLLRGLIALLGIVPTLWPQPRHPFGIDDWIALRSATAVSVSPDGSSVLCLVQWGAKNGKGMREWRLVDSSGRKQDTLDVPDSFTPIGFTRDGSSLYGFYDVRNTNQVAIFALATLTREAKPSVLVQLPAGIHSVHLSPDGSRFAVLADPRLPDPLSGVHSVIEANQTGIYVVNVDGTGGKWWCPNLTRVSDYELLPNISVGSPLTWSPDGRELAVVSETPKIGFHNVRSFLDVCSSGGSRRVIEMQNSVSGVAWGKGGSELVFLSTTNSIGTTDHVWTIPVLGKTPLDRTPALQGSAIALAQGPHGRVWVQMNRGVHSEIDSFQDDALTPVYKWPAGYIANLPAFSQSTGSIDQIALTVGDPTHTENVVVPMQGTLRKITTEGDAELSQVELGNVQVVQWTSKEGVRLEGIATFPAGYSPGHRYPFLVLPHGGPESNDVLKLHTYARLIAGLGYVVLQPEYRGSTGYGGEFVQAIYQHFGDRPFRDVDSATDFAIERGWADPTRLAIFGWSAGGFITAWTVTQTNRYRAAIEGAGITDWASFIWTSDIQQIDYDARWPEKEPSVFLRFSPVAHASHVTTPILILHGTSDTRVPEFQSREFFEVLAANGKTTRYVTYPNSPHSPQLWEQRRDIFREIAAWLFRFNQ